MTHFLQSRGGGLSSVLEAVKDKSYPLSSKTKAGIIRGLGTVSGTPLTTCGVEGGFVKKFERALETM